MLGLLNGINFEITRNQQKLLKSNLMSGNSPFLLLLLPLIFQIIFGIKSVAERLKLNFSKVCLISILSQIIVSFVAFKIISRDLKMRSGGQIRCGMPLVGIITLELFLIIILLVIILIQFLVKKYYNRNDK
jgi:hypothetical protein